MELTGFIFGVVIGTVIIVLIYYGIRGFARDEPKESIIPDDDCDCPEGKGCRWFSDGECGKIKEEVKGAKNEE